VCAPMSALQPGLNHPFAFYQATRNTLVSPEQLVPNRVLYQQPDQGMTSLGDRSMPAVDITVAIPTYNGAERLPRVLEQLRSQQQTQAFSWEVIVCDNNSTDNTAAIVRQYQQDWPTDCFLHYCFAAKQGAAFARQRAIDMARGDLIAFLDDDNIPAIDWLFNVYHFAQQHPAAGAFGSQIHGEFESQSPEGFDEIACYLAIIERGDTPHLYHPTAKILPPAAGLVVRRDAWLQSVPPRLFLNNKGKEAGLASEDLEALLHIQKTGWEIWYNPKMLVTHHIPNNRLRQEYLISLFRCIGLSRFYIRLLGAKAWQRPFLIPGYIANDLRKLALHYLQHPHPSKALPLLEACKREHLQSTAMSPVFLCKKALTDIAENYYERLHLPQREYWLNQLTEAFESDRFQLYQQSVIGLTQPTQDHHQHELLLRLMLVPPALDTDTLTVAPGLFFPTAEHYGLMPTIDRWVIRKLLTPMPAPRPSALEDSTYSINLSSASVCDLTLITFLEEQLARSQIQPHWLCFEISESTALTHPQTTLQVIQDLQRLGCQVALDDVRGRPASLAILQSLPINVLKLNHQLIEATTQRHPAALKRAQRILHLGQQLGIRTVAKGIETQSMLHYVQQLGFPYGQGYQIAKPIAFGSDL
jgi:EAL domain-containing protein (putative c-di-GMP-specific phosphodiesterase class I)/glycosyltransferase involved in cell wall biosynthesis